LDRKNEQEGDNAGRTETSRNAGRGHICKYSGKFAANTREIES
jgi:hypothetical protein